MSGFPPTGRNSPRARTFGAMAPGGQGARPSPGMPGAPERPPGWPRTTPVQPVEQDATGGHGIVRGWSLPAGYVTTADQNRQPRATFAAARPAPRPCSAVGSALVTLGRYLPSCATRGSRRSARQGISASIRLGRAERLLLLRAFGMLACAGVHNKGGWCSQVGETGWFVPGSRLNLGS